MQTEGKSIAQIRVELEQAGGDVLPSLLEQYKADGRRGVQALLEAARRKEQKRQEEYDRVCGMVDFERKLSGNLICCGIDEAGRGPLAGPVVAAAVILPEDSRILYVNDSKKLTESKREELYELICREAIAWGIGSADNREIDRINILQATYAAMRRAINALSMPPEAALVDAVTIAGIDIRQFPVIKGDAKCYSIAAASILAKVTRDRMMREYDKIYPGYGFAGHKGYGSAAHYEAIRQKGVTPIHRMSFLKGILDE